MCEIARLILFPQEDPYKLVTISKDVHPVSLNISDFLIHDGQVAFISSDQQGVMRVLEYDATG
jgi:cleavage and polyadenylation specificity factor subunit 1